MAYRGRGDSRSGYGYGGVTRDGFTRSAETERKRKTRLHFRGWPRARRCGGGGGLDRRSLRKQPCYRKYHQRERPSTKAATSTLSKHKTSLATQHGRSSHHTQKEDTKQDIQFYAPVDSLRPVQTAHTNVKSTGLTLMIIRRGLGTLGSSKRKSDTSRKTALLSTYW